jgi:hypothetical protein
VGLAFKARTDDRAHEPLRRDRACTRRPRAVAFARGTSTSRATILRATPHGSRAPPQALAEADTIVVCHGAPETLAAIASRVVSSHAVVDLTGAERIRFAHARYRSVAFRPERTGE